MDTKQTHSVTALTLSRIAACSVFCQPKPLKVLPPTLHSPARLTVLTSLSPPAFAEGERERERGKKGERERERGRDGKRERGKRKRERGRGRGREVFFFPSPAHFCTRMRIHGKIRLACETIVIGATVTIPFPFLTCSRSMRPVTTFTCRCTNALWRALTPFPYLHR